MTADRTEPFFIDRTPSDDPLDYVSLDSLENIVKSHLPPAVRKIALAWGRMQADALVEDFITTLEPHLCDRVPGFRALATHVLADMDSVEGMCPEFRGGSGGREDDDAA